jgi:hypothetical protein
MKKPSRNHEVFRGMGAVGREHVADSPEKQQMFGASGANSGAPGPETAPDPAEVVKAWPMLSPAVQAGILAMVRASVKGAG